MNNPARFLTAFALSILLSCLVWADEIHEAAKTGDIARLQELLNADPSLVNSPDDNVMTPLHLAAEAGATEAVSLLIRSGANVNAADFQNRIPLHLAAYDGNAEAVKLLLENGADPALRDMRDRLPLAHACYWGKDLETVRLLIDAGSDVNDKNSNSEILVVSALFGGTEEIIDLLFDRGAVLPDDEGTLRRVLYVSAANGMERPFNIAVGKCNKQDIEWWTGIPMNACARGGSVAVARALIDKDTDFREKSQYGVAPLHIAAENGRTEFVEFLLSLGADIDSPSLTGKTALHFARENDHSGLADLLVNMGASQASPVFPELKGDYLGQPAPGKTPQPFALGIVSSHGFSNEHSPAVFSPDGNEVYWTKQYRGPVLCMTRENGVWSAPRPAPFCSEFGDGEPVFSPDGNKLFFLSFRPVEPDALGNKENMWFVERTSDGWSTPKPVSPLINAYDLHWSFSIARNGTIYFPSTRSEGFGTKDIYCSRLIDGEYREPQNLGPAINGAGLEHTPYIAPDESYIIFASTGKTPNIRNFNLLISFRNRDGSWTQPLDLSQKINSLGSPLCPVVTPDGNFLFFLARGDIYWVEAGFIDALRPKE